MQMVIQRGDSVYKNEKNKHEATNKILIRWLTLLPRINQHKDHQSCGRSHEAEGRTKTIWTGAQRCRGSHLASKHRWRLLRSGRGRTQVLSCCVARTHVPSEALVCFCSWDWCWQRISCEDETSPKSAARFGENEPGTNEPTLNESCTLLQLQHIPD